MQVEVRFYAAMRTYAPQLPIGQPLVVDLPDGASVGDVTKMFGIPDDIPKILVVNGIKDDLLRPLKDGDRIGIFSPVGGG